MDTKDSIYVAELLEQLEELKRKKARRMLKLKKISKHTKSEADKTQDSSADDNVSINIESTNPSQKAETELISALKCPECGSKCTGGCTQCIKTNTKENMDIVQSKNINNSYKLQSQFSNEEMSFPNKMICSERLSQMDKSRKMLCIKPNIQFNTDVKKICNQTKNRRVADSRKHKRSLTDDEDPGEVDGVENKKMKKSDEDITSEIENDLSRPEAKKTPLDPGIVPLQSDAGYKSKTVPNDSVDGLEESLSHDMTCFLSSSLLIENDTNISQPAVSLNSHPELLNDQDRDTENLKSDSKAASPEKSGRNKCEVTGLQCLKEAKVSQNELKNQSEVVSVTVKQVPKNMDENTNDEKPSNNVYLTIVGNSSKPFDVCGLKNIISKDLTSALDAHYGSPNKTDTLLTTDLCINAKQNLNYSQNEADRKLKSSSTSVQSNYDFRESQLSPFESSNGVETDSVQVIDNLEPDQTADDCTNYLISDPSTNLESDKNEISSNVRDCYEKDEIFFDSEAILAKNLHFDCDTMTLEVADTIEDLVIKSSRERHDAVGPRNKVSEPCHEIFTIPETECLDISGNKLSSYAKNRSKVTNESVACGSEISKCIVKSDIKNCLIPQPKACCSTSNDDASKQPSKPTEGFEWPLTDSLYELHTVPDTLALDLEDSEELGSCQDIPFLQSESIGICSQVWEELQDGEDTNLKFLYCLDSNLHEFVTDVKLVYFNNSNYMFVQYITWIEVWRQNGSQDCSRVFSHQIVNKLQLKEICFTKNDNHLVLVVLLSTEQGYCLQFLIFHKEAQVIKVMENIHWLQKRQPGETVFLCGLPDMKFASAKGKSNFEVFVHSLNSLEDSPRLITTCLGSTVGSLQSLCTIEKLPNALLGTSDSMLYVWHMLESRLVTSVCLQSEDVLNIHSCIWATIENGLVFLIAVCKDEDDSSVCQLLAVNLATGFCQVYMGYSSPNTDETETASMSNKMTKAAYSEPFLVVAFQKAAFVWSVTDESCLASLDSEADITGINISLDKDDTFVVAVSNREGCVNCYGLKYSL